MPIEILWQRPKRVAAAKLNIERVAESLEQNGLNLVRDVRLGYAELALAEERTRLTTKAVDTRRQIPTIMEARFRGGDISEVEMQTARRIGRRLKKTARGLSAKPEPRRNVCGC